MLSAMMIVSMGLLGWWFQLLFARSGVRERVGSERGLFWGEDTSHYDSHVIVTRIRWILSS